MLAVSALVAGCTSFEFPTFRGFSMPPGSLPGGQAPMPAQPQMAAGETFGTGPVKVALLLPLSDPNLGTLARAMVNGSRLAMGLIETNPNIADNITVTVKDTGTTPGVAAQRASEAVAEGASLILGPLRADDVSAAGAAARAGGVPMIAFSNNSGVAGPGVYLLNVLPEAEARRSLGYARGKGAKKFAAIVPASAYGQAQEGAFQQALTGFGLTPVSVTTFSSEADARNVVSQIAPLVRNGQIDALYLPDRATASSLGVMLEEQGFDRSRLTVIGSADWEGEPNILRTSFLVGAVYPAVDTAGYQALRADYVARFGSEPHPLSTIAYTATILANVSTLSTSTPRYQAAVMTASAGFNGRDGVFRFLPDGRSDYALVIRQVGSGTAQTVDGAKL